MKKTNSHITLPCVKRYKQLFLIFVLLLSTSHFSYSQDVAVPSESVEKKYQLELERQSKILTEQGREIENLKRLIRNQPSKNTQKQKNLRQ